MQSQCGRAWEAEAIEDGRLAELARLSFERHSALCRRCAQERGELANLREWGDRLPSPHRTPLEHRRLRASILREAYRQTPRQTPRRVGVAKGTVAGLAVTLAACAAFSVMHGGLGNSSFTAGADATLAPAFEAVPVGAAAWRVERIGSEVRAALADGRVAVHVTKLTPGQRFVVSLPDGELEVRGTRFVADVHEGRTIRVEVSEGAVALRLRSAPERSLTAGESWSGEVPPQVGVGAEAGSDPNRAEPTAAPLPSETPRARATLKSATLAHVGPHGARVARVEPPNSSGVLFAEAMAIYGAGFFDRADAMLAEFRRRFPEDARCEDADFLRVVIRCRLGDGWGAETRARAYLAEYPGGLRRSEVEALLQRRRTPP